MIVGKASGVYYLRCGFASRSVSLSASGTSVTYIVGTREIVYSIWGSGS